MTPRFFESAADFRRWLEENHDRADALVVGFWKKATGRPSIDWTQARDHALCFGWIDGIRRSQGEASYTVRFTPRREGSDWSQVNVDRFHALDSAGLMTPAGERAFAGRSATRPYTYSDAPDLTPDELASFQANAAAWADWTSRPPGYRRMVQRWIGAAKRPETRARRLATLIEDSAAGRKIAGADVGRKRR